jgi:hypothetical protein
MTPSKPQKRSVRVLALEVRHGQGLFEPVQENGGAIRKENVGVVLVNAQMENDSGVKAVEAF